ncbi:hypothetical protein [Roseimicrobium sp. ORNL1]|uniref:hypothetical protein n=1 Tax=Roseimicrobium sp. ORNL1 TaxID=2711231 RepID=UPI0013E1F0E8|nr:hypothetical protein [Roseimicrobium sp. ORNL1]QIF00738.1 hypothetical protein G5S37_04105 [Roseimicrobium sp. ORNL1]
MALTSEQISSALELDYDANRVAVDEMRKLINAQLGLLDSNPGMRMQLEALVTTELKAWQSAVESGEETWPTTTEDWSAKMKGRLSRAVARHEQDIKEEASAELDDVETYEAQKEQHRKEAILKDRESPIKLQEASETSFTVVRPMAPMDGVAAARLRANEAVGTMALASCTGVSLYDPVTKVCAVMHVFKKADIPHALKVMQGVAPEINPRNLQVTLMPGNADGVNMAHLPVLREQLAMEGITNVRDFSREGRTSSTLTLRGDGVVFSTTEAERLSTSPSLSSVGSSPGGSESGFAPPPPKPAYLPPMPDTPPLSPSPSPSTPEQLPDLLDLSTPTLKPGGLVTSTMGAGTATTSGLAPPPPPGTSEHLPGPEIPEVATRARSRSVGEELGLGKYKRGGPSEGLGAGGPSIGSRQNRSGSF